MLVFCDPSARTQLSKFNTVDVIFCWRLQTNYAKRMKKIRQSTVEPVLGTLINYLSMRRVNTKGIKLANKCMMMAAVAYNLKKLLNWQSKNVQTNVQALQKAVSASIFKLIAFLVCHNTKA